MGASTNNGQPTDNYQGTPTSGFGPAPAQPDYTADARARGRGQGVYNAVVQPGYIPAPNTDFGGPGGTSYQPPALQNTGSPYQGILSALQGMFGGGYSGGGYEEDNLRQPQLPPGMAPGPTMSIGAPGAEYGGLGGSGAGFPAGNTPLRDQLVAPAPQVTAPPMQQGSGVLPVSDITDVPTSDGLLPVEAPQGTAMNPTTQSDLLGNMSYADFMRAMTGMYSPGANQDLVGMTYNDWAGARTARGYSPLYEAWGYNVPSDFGHG